MSIYHPHSDHFRRPSLLRSFISGLELVCSTIPARHNSLFTGHWPVLPDGHRLLDVFGIETFLTVLVTNLTTESLARRISFIFILFFVSLCFCSHPFSVLIFLVG